MTASYDQSSNQETHGDSDPNNTCVRPIWFHSSFDQSSNQATHSGDTEPNNTSIVTDDLGTDDITVEHLRQIFTPFGEFFCLLIIAGTRCGYAQFASRSSAEEAIRNLNGTELAGQKLRLSFANEEVCYKAIKTIAAGWAKAAPPVLDRDPPPPLFNLYKDVETGEMRIQTRVKDLGSDKSVIVDSCPKKTGGNGQASYDQSSNQATHSDTGLMTAFYKRIQVTHSGDRDLKIPNNTSILVDNLVPDVVTKEQLREIFTPYGEVGYVKVMAGTQFGFVQFVSRSCAEEAIKNLNGIELAGQNLKLSFSNKQERGAEYLDNGLPYGWSGSGIFRGLPPLVSDSGLPIEAGGWFSAPSPFMCERVVDPADPRLQPTHEDMESDEAILALYKRWCHANNVQRTPEEMQLRFGFFKKSAIQVFEANRDRPLGSYGLYIWADDPKKEPRGGSCRDPRIVPTKKDVESDEAILALYKRWCDANNVHKDPWEMQVRFGFFKKSEIQVFEANRDRPLGTYGLYKWADDPKN